MSPKEAWEAIKTLKKGLTSHDKDTSSEPRMKLEDGTTTINPKKVVWIFREHFYKVFNCITKADIEFIKNKKSYVRIHKSGILFCRIEFKEAIKRHVWYKLQA